MIIHVINAICRTKYNFRYNRFGKGAAYIDVDTLKALLEELNVSLGMIVKFL